MERIEEPIKDIKNKKIGSTIHKIFLTDTSSSAKECNRKICLLIRKGRSKDKRYDWYPNWSVEIKGENGESITWTPTKKLILSFIDEFLIHEARVDMTRSRKSDTEVYKKHINKIILNIQSTLRTFEIPDIYKQQYENKDI
jgi:hypothetical protein